MKCHLSKAVKKITKHETSVKSHDHWQPTNDKTCKGTNTLNFRAMIAKHAFSATVY